MSLTYFQPYVFEVTVTQADGATCVADLFTRARVELSCDGLKHGVLYTRDSMVEIENVGPLVNLCSSREHDTQWHWRPSGRLFYYCQDHPHGILFATVFPPPDGAVDFSAIKISWMTSASSYNVKKKPLA